MTKSLLNLAAGLLVAAASESPPPRPGASIHAAVSVLRSQSGRLGCSLYDKADGFPRDADKAARRHWLRITGPVAVCEFEQLPPGEYAVAAFHDENGNGEMDAGLFGIPTEGWATSKNVKPALSAPSFEDSKVTLRADEVLRLELTVHY